MIWGARDLKMDAFRPDEHFSMRLIRKSQKNAWLYSIPEVGVTENVQLRAPKYAEQLEMCDRQKRVVSFHLEFLTTSY